MYRIWLAWEAFGLILKHKGRLPALLTAAEELVLAVSTADPQDLRDMETLGPNVMRAVEDIVKITVRHMPIRMIQGELE